MASTSNAGGSAASWGFNFQHRVGAWFAAQILAERGAQPGWGLPTDTSFEWLRLETEQPIDDLLVGTSSGGLIYCQVKRRLTLSSKQDSELASTIHQFVDQFVTHQSRTDGPRPWDRALDPARDRFLLVCGPLSSTLVKACLPSVLDRIRSQVTGEQLGDAAVNRLERRALEALLAHIKAAWQQLNGSPPVASNIRRLLEFVRIQTLDFESGEAERSVETLLSGTVVPDARAAVAAWNLLVSTSARLSESRTGADRSRLQEELGRAGIKVDAAISYREDIGRLQEHSRSTVENLARFAHLRVGTDVLKIRRQSTGAVRTAADAGSLVVLGQPGAGKSGALYDLVEELERQGRDHVLLAVDRLEATTSGALRTELGLEHELLEVLRNWPGEQPAFLVVDSLDAARGEAGATAIRDLLTAVSNLPRWRVVTSIRKFDLRHSRPTRRLFAGQPASAFVDSEFQDVRHVEIPVLSSEEFAQLRGSSPVLYDLLMRVPRELREVLFNVSLMADLLTSGVDRTALGAIETQLELLRRYWDLRVVREDGLVDEREALLGRACEEMIRTRTLHARRAVVSKVSASGQLHELLSRGVIVEWRGGGETPNRRVLAFSHHVLFDYAVAQLVFGGGSGLAHTLEADRDLILVVRPSLVFYLSELWASAGTAGFWEEGFSVSASTGIPEVTKLVGVSVVADLATADDQLAPLYAALEGAAAARRGLAEKAVEHLVGALTVEAETNPEWTADCGPWCEFAERLSRSLRPKTAYSLANLLIAFTKPGRESLELAKPQRDFLGVAVRRLLTYTWEASEYDGWLALQSLRYLCRLVETDVAESVRLLNRTIEPAHLREHGSDELPWVAREVRRLAPFVSPFVEKLYAAAFSYEEQSTEARQLGSGRILTLTSTRRQDYEGALYQLADHYPAFLEADPTAASRALIVVLSSYVDRRHSAGIDGEDPVEFEFLGRSVTLLTDYSHIFDDSGAYSHDGPVRMLEAWEKYLGGGLEKAEGEQLDQVLATIAEHNKLAISEFPN